MGWISDLISIAPVIVTGVDYFSGDNDDYEPTPYQGSQYTSSSSAPAWENISPNYAPVGENEKFMGDWLRDKIGMGTDALYESPLGQNVLETLNKLINLDQEAYPMETTRNLALREDILPRQKARDLLIDNTMGKGGMRKSGAFTQEKLKSSDQTSSDMYNLMDKIRLLNEQAKISRVQTGLGGFKMGGDFLQNLVGALESLSGRRIAADTSAGNVAQSASSSKYGSDATSFSNAERDNLTRWIQENTWKRQDALKEEQDLGGLITALSGYTDKPDNKIDQFENWITGLFGGNRSATNAPMAIPRVADYRRNDIWGSGDILQNQDNPYAMKPLTLAGKY